MKKAITLSCLLTLFGFSLLSSNFITADSITIETFDCAAPVEVCFDLPLNELTNFQVILDDQPYVGGFSGCQFDTIINYTYSTLFGQGNMDPYQLDAWTINGTMLSGQFDDIDELVNLMNTWDPNGDWEHIPSMMLITGGSSSTNYSDMNVTALVNNLPSIIGLNFGFNATGTNLAFDVGQYEVVFIDNLNNCSDTVTVTVNCLALPQQFTFNDTIAADQNPYVYCIDTSELIGNVTQISNVCPELSGTFVSFLIDEESYCVKYQASKCNAEETACIVVCDDLGFCDTTFLNILVDNTICTPPVTEKLTDTLLVAETIELCLNTDELQGTEFTIQNTCEDQSGSAVSFLVNEVSLCVVASALNIGTELACIVICDEFSVCDTTCIEIRVEENPDPCATSTPPTAINDSRTTDFNQDVYIRILDNDIIPDCSPSDFEIIMMPSNGLVIKNLDQSVDYVPNPGFCGTDSFVYELCNDDGCDEATVTVTVSCAIQGELIVYEGFSPNNDGINDAFTIENIEFYPNSELTIFNRWGNSVFTAVGYNNKWTGTYRNLILPSGTYFYLLDVGDGRNMMKGIVELRR